MTQNRENLSSLKRSSQSSDKWVVVSLSSKRNSGDAHRECKDTEHSMMLLMLLMSRWSRRRRTADGVLAYQSRNIYYQSGLRPEAPAMLDA